MPSFNEENWRLKTAFSKFTQRRVLRHERLIRVAFFVVFLIYVALILAGFKAIENIMKEGQKIHAAYMEPLIDPDDPKYGLTRSKKTVKD